MLDFDGSPARGYRPRIGGHGVVEHRDDLDVASSRWGAIPPHAVTALQRVFLAAGPSKGVVLVRASGTRRSVDRGDQLALDVEIVGPMDTVRVPHDRCVERDRAWMLRTADEAPRSEKSRRRRRVDIVGRADVNTFELVLVDDV